MVLIRDKIKSQESTKNFLKTKEMKEKKIFRSIDKEAFDRLLGITPRNAKDMNFQNSLKKYHALNIVELDSIVHLISTCAKTAMETFHLLVT